MKLKNVHDVWTVGAEQIEALKKDAKELARTHEMANMLGKMRNAIRDKLEAMKMAKIIPTPANLPEIMSNP